MCLISFCIPTYNRAVYLEELLESIYECDYIVPISEVVVSDNCSEDGTFELLSEYAKKYPNFRFKVNKENLGADLNYLSAIGMAKGEYCWFLGSDDILDVESVEKLAKKIELNRNVVDIYLTNRIECDIKMNPRGRKGSQPKNLSSFQYEFVSLELNNLQSYYESCTSLCGILSYISSLVFKREIWSEDRESYEYIGTHYVYLYILTKAMLKGANLFYVPDIFVYCRGGNDTFAADGRGKRFLIDYMGIYKLYSDPMWGGNVHEKNAFLNVLHKDHPFIKRIIAVWCCLEEGNIKQLCHYLRLTKLSVMNILLAVALSPIYPSYLILKRFFNARKRLK